MVFVLAGIIGDVNGVLIVPWISIHHIPSRYPDAKGVPVGNMPAFMIRHKC
jgi:hypothetical protein